MERHTKDAINRFLTTANANKPLIVCDADEVLLQFFVTLEQFLDEEGYYVRLDTFALNGNIRHVQSDDVAAPETISALMQQFFIDPIHTSPAVDGAAEALARLSRQAEVCVVTNLPGEQASARAEALKRLGIDYPVICNTGGKGPALRHVADHWNEKIAFIDDLPPNHDSVAKEAPDVHRIHYVADERLAKLIKKPSSAHTRATCWPTLEQYLFNWMA